MPTLILDRSPGHLPFAQWLADSDTDYVVIGSHACRPADEVADRPSATPLALAAAQLASVGYATRHKPTALVALSLSDKVFAGTYRDTFGLPGHGKRLATVSFDDVVGRAALACAGVEVVASAAVQQILDLHLFAERHGYPLRVRGRTRCANRTGAVVNSAADLDAYRAGGLAPRKEVVPDLLVEVAGPAPRRHIVGHLRSGDPIRVSSDRPQPRDEQLLGRIAGALADAGGEYLVHVEAEADAVYSVSLDPAGPRARRLFLDLLDLDLDRCSARLQAGLPITQGL